MLSPADLVPVPGHSSTEEALTSKCISALKTRNAVILYPGWLQSLQEVTPGSSERGGRTGGSAWGEGALRS